LTNRWWSPERGPILRWPLLVLGAGFSIAVALALVQWAILAPRNATPPKVVADVAGAMRALAGDAAVDVEHETSPFDAWNVRVFTGQPEVVRDAVLHLFDGRGYSVVRHDEPRPSGCPESEPLASCYEWATSYTDSTVSIANDALFIYWAPVDGPVTVWVPTARLGDDGYPVAALGPLAPPATPTPSDRAAGDCAALLSLRDAYADAKRAVAATRAGRHGSAVAAAASAKETATALITAILPAPSGEPTRPLSFVITGAAVNIATFGAMLTDPNGAPLTDEQLSSFLTDLTQTVGSAEAVATGANGAAPACPGIQPLADALPTLAPIPTPSDGPRPPGTIDDQRASALAAVHLEPAQNVQFDSEARVRWYPGGGTGAQDLTLDNATGAPITIPFDLTVLRWTGSGWEHRACDDQLSAEGAAGLCSVKDVNTQLISPGKHTSDTGPELLFSWPGTPEVPPGTYALVLPVWRGGAAYPDHVPTEGVVAIVTLTSNP
jgi:hypothetical protein